jgi:hypothetical protein
MQLILKMLFQFVFFQSILCFIFKTLSWYYFIRYFKIVFKSILHNIVQVHVNLFHCIAKNKQFISDSYIILQSILRTVCAYLILHPVHFI